MSSIKLRDLLRDTYNGRIVLPDFQRSFVWYPEDVRELLVSVFGGYFIGSMLFLESTREEAPFALRLIEGVEKVNPEARIQYSVRILLDGQQRTTALFYAFHAPNIPLSNRKYPHKFYVDIKKALAEEWEDAIIGVSIADRRRLAEIRRNRYMVPLTDFTDLEALVSRFEGDPNIPVTRLIKLYNDVMEYEIHVITLPSETSLDKIVETFERLNKTGMPLSTFDLATARLYKYGINLRSLHKEAQERYEFAKILPPELILKVIALIRGKEPRRKNLLELDHNNFYEEWERACRALELAYRRMTDIKNGYGILDFKKWAPYSTLIVPLAAMLDYLHSNKKESPENYTKIDAFYWTAVFTNKYDHAVDSQSFSDFNDFILWVEEGIAPEFIEKFDPETVDLDVSSVASAIFKGVLSLIVLKGALDFKTGQPPQFELYRNKIQVDHIFPRSLYNEDRVANRTIITTNQSKSNKKPSEYFKERIQELGEESVLNILATHLIPPEALEALLKNDLETFMELRKRAIIDEIKRRVGVGV
ncbi:hypothetical protein TBCH5v1_2153 [Thermococcus barophilus]|uniref:DUF262 domain-containing protein n=2 Tax=Thermococcus barophilus TaxID=55802 RepID=A0A0S1XE36_THEBA|nr:hypothetical protein TBCH5v1_2153 [Thermococcus barophilus]